MNWYFLPEQLMISKGFSTFLTIIHLSLLIIFLLFKWTSIEKGISSWLKEIRLIEFGNTPKLSLDPRYIALTMFSCNMIGILCLRSMHAQFYASYHQTIGLMLLFVKEVSTATK
jgi:alpha-1,3-mannosyltransferase